MLLIDKKWPPDKSVEATHFEKVTLPLRGDAGVMQL